MGMPMGLSKGWVDYGIEKCKDSYKTLSTIRSAESKCNIMPPNPNPYKFEILDIFEKNNYTVVKVHYVGCTNFEGIKILLFEGNIKDEILKLNALDPHFMENGKFTLLARFRPDEKGWKFLNMLLQKEIE